ncbi:hypothetical protein [Nocardia xishanensis]|uniref:hypothetical protein n=1 Tax=Nocardia xishanensis TaxID=238964 RepID=UPI000837A52D|nr:hypothetical protein [Nocardia xishanensis]
MLDALLAASELTLPLPDTGTLRGDPTAFGAALIDLLDIPIGHGLFRALAFVTSATCSPATAPTPSSSTTSSPK